PGTPGQPGCTGGRPRRAAPRDENIRERVKESGSATRIRGVEQLEFEEFYRSGQAVCLRAVLASVGDRETAEDLVAEAFTRAWMSWSTVSRHPAPYGWIV